MDEKIRNIISLYTGIPASSITSQTIIDRTAVSSSILLHRMYADLNKEGFIVQDYFSVKNYGQLLTSLNGGAEVFPQVCAQPLNRLSQDATGISHAVGIDVEEISSMPAVNDYREDAFYTMNFSSSEIAYCILQTDPRASFAGLFAAKEAIVKADNNYQYQSFSTITIDHLPAGKPVHSSFGISISHTHSLAIAVAVKLPPSSSPNSLLETDLSKDHSSKNPLLFLTSLAALIISLIAVLFILFKKT